MLLDYTYEVGLASLVSTPDSLDMTCISQSILIHRVLDPPADPTGSQMLHVATAGVEHTRVTLCR